MSAPVLPPGGHEHLCDHTSVGVLISSRQGLLVFCRATPPVGIAPVAGHIDRHGGPEQAARNEVAEEVGFTVTGLRLLLTQWQPNRCRRTPIGPTGHQWWIFHAQVTGSLLPSPTEVRAPHWVHPDRLQHYALRTAAYADGRMSSRAFEHEPGLAPVWCHFLHTLQLISLPSHVLDRIGAVL
ncbi:NUDIX hydrolase [Streptomyces mobaraensis]|uniref:NUDIX hydrolase n=1 Tax=Streptomyces mobaraensis TaxID=35621 RepID=A0A5N5W168_STRMB|nr:NUDIX hydrolase [Streptomyces mobaraensis]KAB7835540.1 NUDIX hydrolase [Streptomyces mobaraensis]